MKNVPIVCVSCGGSGTGHQQSHVVFHVQYDALKSPTALAHYEPPNARRRAWCLVVEAMSATQRAALLHFATGSARAPATGFAQLMGYGGNRQPFTLQSVDGPPTRLPTAATCFNTLRLAAYRTQAELKQKLLQAVAGSSGFDENAIAV